MGSLLDQADDAPNVVGGKALQGHPVERDLPGVRREEAHDQVGEGGLAGAARADQGDATSGRELQVDATQRGTPGARIGGPDVAQGERVWRGTDRRRCRRVVHDRRRVHGLEDPRRRHP